MNWQITYIADENLIYVKTSGVVTSEAANSMLKEIVEVAVCHQCDRQIIDHSGADFALRLFELYERPSINVRIGLSHKWKIAMIFSELTQNTFFMETVFRNRGYNFRQFDNLEKARTWILSE
ncbi:MAG TPA: hypothetical protein PKE35_06735 [Anaerolineales bacterium]|nr:hypothetical protein [Anaerolineales bacterium]HMV95179.1 hypothetical protein [Anaerolineales bacterium]HMX20200.1 hypothetical protein [Anaerolineales bacterium]HMX73928.1 hypothetical protein [Anaerolineales bacterium]HMZ42767.1 hypothetical protein [Anaerolineales bacterium]